MRKIQNLVCPQQVRLAQAHDPEFVRAVFTLAARIRREYRFHPGEWREALYFFCAYAEELGIDAVKLEQIANLSSLDPTMGEEDAEMDADNDLYERKAEAAAKLFEDNLRHWFANTLGHVPTAARPYVHSSTRVWFLTVANILKAIFPDVIRHKPIWNSPRHRRTWKQVKAAWEDTKDRQVRADSRSKKREKS